MGTQEWAGYCVHPAPSCKISTTLAAPIARGADTFLSNADLIQGCNVDDIVTTE